MDSIYFNSTVTNFEEAKQNFKENYEAYDFIVYIWHSASIFFENMLTEKMRNYLNFLHNRNSCLVAGIYVNQLCFVVFNKDKDISFIANDFDYDVYEYNYLPINFDLLNDINAQKYMHSEDDFLNLIRNEIFTKEEAKKDLLLLDSYVNEKLLKYNDRDNVASLLKLYKLKATKIEIRNLLFKIDTFENDSLDLYKSAVEFAYSSKLLIQNHLQIEDINLYINVLTNEMLNTKINRILNAMNNAINEEIIYFNDKIEILINNAARIERYHLLQNTLSKIKKI